MYADVIVNIAASDLDRSFQYRVPESLADRVFEGSRVVVPFGQGGRTTEGYVINLDSEPKIEEDRIKDILSVPGNAVNVEHRLMQLAAWIRRTCGSTMIQAIKTVMPVKFKAKEKTERSITFAGTDEKLATVIEECKRKHMTARLRLFYYLSEYRSISWKEATGSLKLPAAALRELEAQNLIRISESTVYRMPQTDVSGDSGEAEAPLNEEQQQVYDGILEEWEDRDRPSLIFGITGSGKTHIYMKLIEKVMAEGKDSILLIPEISLTWQTVKRFYARFGDKVCVLHSRLSAGERSDLLSRMDKGEVNLVIGPRSALFSPFKNLGLIIVDEEHDSSYESELTPRYHAAATAVERGRIEHAHVVLGSATPSVESAYKAKTGQYALFRLENRYGSAVLPEVEIIDMRKELAEGNRSIFSRRLYAAMEERLAAGQQIMLFLNRRGHTGFISCRSCGYVVKCPHCDVALTLHRNGKLICHYCGYSVKNMKICPSCGSPYIGGFKAGTQQVEDLVKKCFPDARVLRMDSDSTREKDSYAKILSEFSKGGADILIGTQMIVKGHDFPKVTLVGILAADTSLFASDYRGGERTYQLIAQACGRAGRGALPGLAVVQTYHPDDPVITAAADADYDSFFESEMEGRSLLGYPPAGALLEIHASCPDEQLLQTAMAHAADFLKRIVKGENTVILGPAPENIAKIKDSYRSIIYVKEASKEEIIRLRSGLEKYIRINRGFDNISISYNNGK